MKKEGLSEKNYIHEVPIAGNKIKVTRTELDINDIELDPDNPRIGYWTDNQLKENFTQNEISFALREKTDEVNRLKYNIEVHEGIANPIWVFPISKNKYKVIDGNTRLEIYRELNKKYPNKDCYKKIPSEVLPKDIDERCKDFIRLLHHLRGVNNWEVYERARMLYLLWDKRGYTEEDLKAQTKLSINDIRKWIAAYRNMSEQFLPEYGNNPDALNKFSYFVEYENPKIKQGMADVNLTITDFCKWVGLGEIERAMDVRNLQKIFENEKIKETLATKGYSYALQELNIFKPGLTSKLFQEIEDILYRLKSMTREEEEEIVEGDMQEKKKLIKDLHKELGKIVRRF